LTISGDRKEEIDDTIETYVHMGIDNQNVKRTFRIPVGVSSEEVKCVYSNGIINIKLEKKPEAIEKEIQVDYEW